MYLLKIAPNPGARIESYAAVLRGGAYGGHQFMKRVIGGDFVYCHPRPDVPEFYAYATDVDVTTPGGFQVQAKPVPEIKTGTALRFTLALNATRTIKQDGGRGKRIGLAAYALRGTTGSDKRGVIYAAAHDWLAKHARGFGLDSLQVDADRRVRTLKKGSEIVLDVLDLSGTLTVTDSAEFRAGLLAGYGRAKGFGFGMLLVKKRSLFFHAISAC